MKDKILGFILGILVTSTVGVGAALVIGANEVSLNSSHTNKTTVKDSLDEIYDNLTTDRTNIINALNTKGIPTAISSTYSQIVTSINNSNITPKNVIYDPANGIDNTTIGTEMKSGSGTSYYQKNASNINIYSKGSATNAVATSYLPVTPVMDVSKYNYLITYYYSNAGVQPGTIYSMVTSSTTSTTNLALNPVPVPHGIDANKTYVLVSDISSVNSACIVIGHSAASHQESNIYFTKILLV